MSERARATKHWVGSWAASPQGPFVVGPLMTFGSGTLHSSHSLNNVTIRQIIHTSIGGKQVRVRFSNIFGTQPLVIGNAHLAIHTSGSNVKKGSVRPLSFSGQLSTTIPPGELCVSDPLDLDVLALQDLAVSVYSPGDPAASGITLHLPSQFENFVSIPGNHSSAVSMPTALVVNSWFSLVGLDVYSCDNSCAVVVIGDCTTDGASSTVNTHRRWTDILAKRLLSRGLNIGVLNSGIIGNRLLYDGPRPFEGMFGKSALARFDRDVLDQIGVRYVIVCLGGGDILHPEATAPVSEEVSAADIIVGLQELARRARARGFYIFAGTLTPFEGGFEPRVPNYYSPTKEAKRQAVNQWIRTTSDFNGVIDIDRTVCDPDRPIRLLPAFDHGDHMHLNDAGHMAVGECVDIPIFGLSYAAHHCPGPDSTEYRAH